MPTSSQALILLNVDSPNLLSQHIPQINEFQSSVRRNSTHTDQPLNSSPVSPQYCHHRLSLSKSQYFAGTKSNSTFSADNTQPTKTSLYSSLEFLYQREPSAAIQKHDPTKASLRINNTDSLCGKLKISKVKFKRTNISALQRRVFVIYNELRTLENEILIDLSFNR